MSEHNRSVVERAAKIAYEGLDRAIEDAEDEIEEAYFISLRIAIDTAPKCRSLAESLFFCLAVTAILSNQAGDLMPLLRKGLAEGPPKITPQANITPSRN